MRDAAEASFGRAHGEHYQDERRDYDEAGGEDDAESAERVGGPAFHLSTFRVRRVANVAGMIQECSCFSLEMRSHNPRWNNFRELENQNPPPRRKKRDKGGAPGARWVSQKPHFSRKRRARNGHPIVSLVRGAKAEPA